MPKTLSIILKELLAILQFAPRMVQNQGYVKMISRLKQAYLTLVAVAVSLDSNRTEPRDKRTTKRPLHSFET
jgi:hypothetical protein